ncbi:MAG TPA: hypothetical protein VFV96_08515 [Verrucomicrobiae bacterium]|nr:hypothetical protein [Verrucomicrobiae bacterium]
MNHDIQMPNAVCDARSGLRSGFARPFVRAMGGLGLTLALFFGLGKGFAQAADGATNTVADAAPVTPREYFNAGTRLLRAGRLREAESYLQTAIGRQDPALQPAALYNLGHVRFAQGVEELKKAPDGRQAAARARNAAWQGEAAIRSADNALAGQDVDRLVAAYLQGAGARHELSGAMKAVRQALEAYGGVLQRWQRAADDFKSAAELNPHDANARQNAEVVERQIARLIDQIREMQQAMAAAAQARQQLKEKMKQMRGKIPDSRMPPGAPGEDDEDEDMPEGPQPGMQEGAGKTGKEMKLSPEEASQILNGYRLDGDRRLPMGQDQQGKPLDPNRPTW